ncbi:Nascent Polypeptide-Associated Complex Subunit Alpha-Like Protein-Like [Manis pentadactyla]|nr:Nascent Polypeptide-Associated Complex Subunit Alpha-Like Protein-Like [Manis pentadactyla]
MRASLRRSARFCCADEGWELRMCDGTSVPPSLAGSGRRRARAEGETETGGCDWWFGWRGPAAEPASWREEGAANFPGEGALSAPGLARELLPPRARTPGSGRFGSQSSESNVGSDLNP